MLRYILAFCFFAFFPIAYLLIVPKSKSKPKRDDKRFLLVKDAGEETYSKHTIWRLLSFLTEMRFHMYQMGMNSLAPGAVKIWKSNSLIAVSRGDDPVSAISKIGENTKVYEAMANECSRNMAVNSAKELQKIIQKCVKFWSQSAVNVKLEISDIRDELARQNIEVPPTAWSLSLLSILAIHTLSLISDPPENESAILRDLAAQGFELQMFTNSLNIELPHFCSIMPVPESVGKSLEDPPARFCKIVVNMPMNPPIIQQTYERFARVAEMRHMELCFILPLGKLGEPFMKSPHFANREAKEFCQLIRWIS